MQIKNSYKNARVFQKIGRFPVGAGNDKQDECRIRQLAD